MPCGNGCAATPGAARSSTPSRNCPTPEHPGHQVAADQQLWLLELFTSLATDAGLRTPDDLAHQLLCLYEGALAVQTPATTRSSAETVADAASVLVRAAAPSAP